MTAVWTLGGAGGVQTITASITGVPAITVTATAIATTGIAYSLVNFGNWTDSTRWSPVGIPGANDDVTIGGDNSVTLMGNTVVHSLTFSLGSVSMGAYDLTVLGNVTGTEAYYSGTGALRIAGAGSHVLNILSVPTLAVDAGAIVAQGGHVTATGDVIVAGMLVPNGHRLNVQGLLNVLPGGGLKMTQALDTVFTWDASFAGVASDTLLTAGYLSVGDNFTQAGVAKSFAPTGTHVTVLTANAINLALRTDRASASTSGRPAGRAAAETAVPAGRRRNFLTYNQISFANPGYTASHFNLLRFSQLHDLDFATNVYATRADAVGDTLNTHYVRGAGGKLFMKNGNLVNLIFNGPVLQVDAANSLTRLDSLTFIAPATADQLTLNMVGGGTPTLTKLSFSTGPSTGRYLVVNGAGTATMVKTMPGSHGGFVGTSGGGAISGWIASRNMTATSTGNWTTPGTWSPAGLPSRYDTVTIATGASVTLDAGGRVRDMVIAAGGSFNTPSYTSLDVYGNWTADTTSTVTGGVSAAYTNFYGNAQVRGRLWGASVNKAMTLVGRTIFDGYVSVGDYAYTPITFDVNGQVATINGGFSTFYGGRLKMTSPTGDLSVCCNLFFTGGSTDGLLTDGILRVTGNFTGSGAAFSATGNHKTIVSSPGGFGNSISFDTPGSTSLTGHFGILQLSDTVHSTTLSSDVYAVTKLATLGTGSPVTLVGAATTLHAPTAVSTNPLVFSRVRLHLYNASASTVLSNATFQNFTSTAFETQLTVEGAGTIAMSSLLFSTSVANTYNYLFANNLGAGLTLNLTSMSPILSATAGKIAVSGTPLAVVNWSP